MFDERRDAMNNAEFLDAYPSLNQTLLNSKFLDIIPGGFSIAIDVSCETIVHNPITAKFLRIEPWESFSFTSKGISVKLYQNGKLLTERDLPTQRAAWYGEEVVGCEIEFVWEDGISRIGRFSSSPLRDESGKICGAITTMEDITDIVHMARELGSHKTQLEHLVEDLQKSEGLFHAAIENMIDCVSICTAVRNKDGQIVDFIVDYVNQAACKNSQMTKDDLTGHSLLAFSPKVIESGFFEAYCKVIETGEPFYSESIYYSNYNNKYVDGAYENQTFKLRDGVVATYRNITQRKRDEISTLALSEERFNKVFQASPNMMAIVREADRVYIDVNEAFEKIMRLKKEDVLGKSVRDVTKMDEVDDERIWSELGRNGKIDNMELHMKNKRTLLFSIVPTMLNGEKCYISSHVDITELKKSQEEIARLNRLDLVGQMAAGIAHEIRNPMTTVRGYLQLLGEKQEYASQRSTFELMISELDRANSIITEFLSLARNQSTNLKYQNLNDLLKNLYPILEANAFNQNKMIEFIPGEIPDIQLNTKEIHQLVLNLCHNGLEAMKEHTRLTIRTFANGGTVVMSVQDEGCGIEIKDIAKLGTPFFTTKESGTGLGLAMCYSIAASHNASIDVDTSPQGTTFFVRFKPFSGETRNV